MKLCDMHCDTLTELYSHRYSISDCPLHISLDGAREIDPYVQLAAVWTDNTLSDEEGYRRFFDVLHHFENDPAVISGKARLIRRADDLAHAETDGAAAFILGVEGARILSSDISRLDTLEDAGVRLMTLQWSGTDCIGGSFDTDSPLTDFGRTVVKELSLRGMAVDLSHSCDRTAGEAIDIALTNGGAVCASHSNSRVITNHPRNLPDDLFKKIRDCGGVVGISLCPHHLREGGNADAGDVLRHILHYLSLDGEDTVCLGCDFDGIETTPTGIEGISMMDNLKYALASEGLGESVIEKIFYKNSRRFLENILG